MFTTVKGQAFNLDAVQKFLDAEYHRWFAENSVGVSASLKNASRFLMESADDLVVLVENLLLNGIDKKATVLDALARLFNKAIAPNLPIWARLIMPIVRYILINIVASSSIDYIVKKYNNGTAMAASMAWKKKDD